MEKGNRRIHVFCQCGLQLHLAQCWGERTGPSSQWQQPAVLSFCHQASPWDLQCHYSATCTGNQCGDYSSNQARETVVNTFGSRQKMGTGAREIVHTTQPPTCFVTLPSDLTSFKWGEKKVEGVAVPPLKLMCQAFSRFAWHTVSLQLL